MKTIGIYISARSFSALIGKFVFVFLVLGDFVSFSISTVTGLPSVPFGLIAYSIAFLYLISYGQLNLIQLKTNRDFWISFICFLIFFFSVILRIIFDPKVLFIDIFLVFRYLIFIIAGILIGQTLIHYQFKNLFLFSFLVMIIVLASLMDFKNYSFLLLMEGDANYLRIAEWFVFCSLGVISYIKNRGTTVLIFLVSLIALFFINSRFALAAYCLIGSFIIIYRFSKKGVVLLVCITLFLGVFFAFIMNGNSELFLNNRVLRLILSPELDTSLLSRQEIQSYGLEAIRNNWFTGDFRGQVQFGEYGSYIHNILSYWRQYGIIPFFLFSLLLFIIWINVLSLVKDKQLRKPHILFAFSYLIFSTLGVILAKAFVYTEIFMAFGIIISLHNNNQEPYPKNTDQIS